MTCSLHFPSPWPRSVSLAPFSSLSTGSATYPARASNTAPDHPRINLCCIPYLGPTLPNLDLGVDHPYNIHPHPHPPNHPSYTNDGAPGLLEAVLLQEFQREQLASPFRCHEHSALTVRPLSPAAFQRVRQTIVPRLLRHRRELCDLSGQSHGGLIVALPPADILACFAAIPVTATVLVLRFFLVLRASPYPRTRTASLLFPSNDTGR